MTFKVKRIRQQYSVKLEEEFGKHILPEQLATLEERADSFQGNDSQGRHSVGGGRSLHNLGPWGHPWPLAPLARQCLSSEKKKNTGCLVVCPGSALFDFLAKHCEKYCTPFQVKGLSYADEGCTRKHVPFVVGTKEEHEAQCENVERNKNQMMFVPGTRLEDKFQHLIKNGERN